MMLCTLHLHFLLLLIRESVSIHYHFRYNPVVGRQSVRACGMCIHQAGLLVIRHGAHLNQDVTRLKQVVSCTVNDIGRDKVSLLFLSDAIGQRADCSSHHRDGDNQGDIAVSDFRPVILEVELGARDHSGVVAEEKATKPHYRDQVQQKAQIVRPVSLREAYGGVLCALV